MNQGFTWRRWLWTALLLLGLAVSTGPLYADEIQALGVRLHRDEALAALGDILAGDLLPYEETLAHLSALDQVYDRTLPEFLRTLVSAEQQFLINQPQLAAQTLEEAQEYHTTLLQVANESLTRARQAETLTVASVRIAYAHLRQRVYVARVAALLREGEAVARYQQAGAAPSPAQRLALLAQGAEARRTAYAAWQAVTRREYELALFVQRYPQTLVLLQQAAEAARLESRQPALFPATMLTK